MRIIVCGGRDYQNSAAVNARLDEIHAKTPIEAVIHGNASGADRLGGIWANTRGVKCWPVSAQWSKFGRAAGPKRNQQMLGMGVSLVVAFPGGRGTRDMVKRAEKAGVSVISVEGQ